MSLSRRQFVIASLGLCAGCQSQSQKHVGDQTAKAPSPRDTIDAGLTSKYNALGIYSDFRQQGFFIIRRSQKLIALSSICTHNGCKLNVAPDQSFFCKCHGSIFDPDGKVEQGPAEDDLPVLPTRIDENGHLLVDATAAHQDW
jgi:Rieske Fe-S protein